MIDLNRIKELFETQKLELKKSLSLKKEGLSSLCGMINTDAAIGQVIFGISPDMEIVGVGKDNLDTIQKGLAQTIHNKFDPKIIADIQIIEHNGLKVVSVQASRSIENVYHEFDGRAFMREGSLTRILKISEKESLSKKRNREKHNGPWKCDKCGTQCMTFSGVELTAKGMMKTFSHDCGGEFWPI
jgi:predicted HTH transcriptional regulator